jgi:simple sugar transport system permease protein
MKGLIIVGTVLVQEQNLGQVLAGWRRRASPLLPGQARSTDPDRPRGAATTGLKVEEIDETS